VLDLLEDINGFKPHGESFYCLQQLVVQDVSPVNKKKTHFELIDGQQRLTTSFIILKCLNEQLYNIEYDTRPSSAEFLKKITTLDVHIIPLFQQVKELSFQNIINFQNALNEQWKLYTLEFPDNNNVDNYHFYIAYQTISNWLLKNEEITQHFLLNLKKHTKVIWYEIITNLTPEEVFINFNQGKIHLEQAELIKALFVLSLSGIRNIELRGFKTNQFAEEWNTIENQLQDDKFWYFVSNDTSDKKEANRIDYLFDVICEKPKTDDNSLFSYHFYLQKFNQSELKMKIGKR
jgi:uncharacterized protein with ParB-like and HNH nuclease domain